MKPDAANQMLRQHSKTLGFEIGAHFLRASAATKALDDQADIAKVQLSLSTFPEVSPKKARDRRDQARRDLAKGFDPRAKRRTEKARDR